jgi:hypothetical protein
MENKTQIQTQAQNQQIGKKYRFPETPEEWYSFLINWLGIPRGLIDLMVTKKLIAIPPDDFDLDYLTFLSNLLDNLEEFLYCLLSQLPRRKLNSLVNAVINRTPTKLQKWLLSRITNLYQETGTCYINQVVEEAIKYFNILPEKRHYVKKEAIRIRNRVLKRRSRAKQKQKT